MKLIHLSDSQLRAILSSKRHLLMSGEVFGCQSWGDATDIGCLQDRDAPKHSVMHRLAPHNKELFGPKCAAVDNIAQSEYIFFFFKLIIHWVILSYISQYWTVGSIVIWLYSWKIPIRLLGTWVNLRTLCGPELTLRNSEQQWEASCY